MGMWAGRHPIAVAREACELSSELCQQARIVVARSAALRSDMLARRWVRLPPGG